MHLILAKIRLKLDKRFLKTRFSNVMWSKSLLFNSRWEGGNLCSNRPWAEHLQLLTDWLPSRALWNSHYLYYIEQSLSIIRPFSAANKMICFVSSPSNSTRQTSCKWLIRRHSHAHDMYVDDDLVCGIAQTIHEKGYTHVQFVLNIRSRNLLEDKKFTFFPFFFFQVRNILCACLSPHTHCTSD